jgi:hypothetical protein
MNSRRSETARAFDPNNLKARDVLVLVPLIVGILICFVIFAFQVGDVVYIKWGGLGINTATLFGFLLYHSREQFKSKSFWIVGGCFLALHLTTWIALLTFVDEWRLAWFGVMALEAPTFLYLSKRPSHPE